MSYPDNQQVGPHAMTVDARQLHEIMDSLSPSIFLGQLTVDGILTYTNRPSLDAIGAKPEDVLGKPFETTPWWSASESLRQRLRAAIQDAANGTASRFDITIERSDGRTMVMDFTLHPVFGNDGRVAYLIPAAYDITERKQVEQTLRLTQFAVDHAQDAMFQVDSKGRLHYVNDAGCRLLGYSREELMKLVPFYQINMLLPEKDWPTRRQDLKRSGAMRFESIYRHADGHGIPVDVSFSYIDFEGEEYGFVYVRDISERKAADARIHYLAHYDALTGLPNRTLLHEQLSKTIEFAGRHHLEVTVLHIGLDRFKLVNDTLGHAAGNEVIRLAANRLSACVCGIDTVARIGDDEFVIVLAGDPTKDHNPLQEAQRIKSAFVSPMTVDGHELFITCSIGMAVYPRTGTDMSELLKNACIAMFHAKTLGRNTIYVYSTEFRGRDPERLSLETAMRKMLEQNEFRLFFQPQVDPESGAIKSIEALLRWQEPGEGIMSPLRFIPIAEETGLIVPIGDWVLQECCLQRKAWHEQGFKLGRLGVNLSSRQFHQNDLVGKIERTLKETGVDPQQMELELTESTLMQDVESAIHIMSALKDMGIRISLDDFGTGYSSLSYLKRFPIDTLKIDQSFVQEITFDRNSATIVDSIIAMAHRMHLTVIAEGVETESQLAMLRAQGCDLIQGYYFFKPMPPQELTALL